jgi:hypothetical protein
VIHAEYLERCFIQGGGNAKAAGSPLIVDNVGIMVTRPVPFAAASGASLLDKSYNLAGGLKSSKIAYILPNAD